MRNLKRNAWILLVVVVPAIVAWNQFVYQIFGFQLHLTEWWAWAKNNIFSVQVLLGLILLAIGGNVICRLAVLIWPFARKVYLGFAGSLQWEIANRTRHIPIGNYGDLASSIVVFLHRRDTERYYVLLEEKTVDNESGKTEKMYPGARVQTDQFPELVALDYVRNTLGLKDVRLSDRHHNPTSTSQYVSARHVVQAPGPFKILQEMQPQRGRRRFNYDMIYVGYLEHNGGALPSVPHCEWRSLEEIQTTSNSVMLEDVRQAIMDAAAPFISHATQRQ